MLKRRILSVLIVLIFGVLSACSPINKIPEDTLWVNQNPYLAPQQEFLVAGLPAYVDEDPVFRLENEMEVALMSALQYDEGNLKYHYVSTNPLSLNRIFAYLETLLPFSFTLSMSELTYTQEESLLITLYALEIQPVFNHLDQLKGIVSSFNQQYLSASPTPLESIRIIHDRLILDTQYDTSVLDLDLTQIPSHLSFEAYGLLSEHRAVCSGYARAFNALAKSADIPSIMISSATMQHAWNLVYDGSAWRYIDVTFDDPIPDLQNRVRYTYFLLEKSAFLQDGKHTFDQSSESRLSAQEYLEFAEFVFKPNS